MADHLLVQVIVQNVRLQQLSAVVTKVQDYLNIRECWSHERPVQLTAQIIEVCWRPAASVRVLVSGGLLTKSTVNKRT